MCDRGDRDWSGFLLGLGALLSFFSLVLVLYNAAEEPFYGIKSIGEAISQVGVTLCLALLWLQWSALVCYACRTRRISFWWLLSLAWAFVCIWVMWICASGYVGDNLIYQQGKI